jgi:ribosomal protein L16/L10AE
MQGGKSHRIFLKKFFSDQCKTYRYEVTSQMGRWSIRPVIPFIFQEKHFEAMRRILLRLFSKSFRLGIIRLPVQPVSAKPREIRMGKGKGDIAFKAANILGGQPLYYCIPTALLPTFILVHGFRSFGFKLGRGVLFN